MQINKKTILVDADVTCFQSMVACQNEIEWDEDTWSVWADMQRAKELFDSKIEAYKKLIRCKEILLCYSFGDNFRKKLNPTYKGNRGKKPVGYGALKDWSMEVYPHFVKPGLEADDCIGILHTLNPATTVPVTIDKDFLTFPGKILRLNPQGVGTWHETSEEDANMTFLTQVLTGDVTDGYHGIKGYGPKTAAKLIASKGAVWKTVADAYAKAGMTPEDCLMNARMARILQASDWDFEKDEMKLWQPPSAN